eukprot:TRINITY_DN1752_c0_g1_i4.p1 TRINITY_DN1752_c0_g1~~TRINITY_DN1752_c0_g1_i4.p1  ORF type:complete len:1558 (-),score=439.44 TRINITY_DN1752_c0_g1_i4:1765-6249(-)
MSTADASGAERTAAAGGHHHKHHKLHEEHGSPESSTAAAANDKGKGKEPEVDSTALITSPRSEHNVVANTTLAATSCAVATESTANLALAQGQSMTSLPLLQQGLGSSTASLPSAPASPEPRTPMYLMSTPAMSLYLTPSPGSPSISASQQNLPEFKVEWDADNEPPSCEDDHLPQVIDFFLYPALVEGVPDRDQKASLFCTKFLSKVHRSPLTRKDEMMLEKYTDHFKVLDLTLQGLPQAKAIVECVHKKKFAAIERVALSCWDSGLLGKLPKTATVLVLTNQETTDSDIGTIKKRCHSLEKLRIENGDLLTNKAVHTIASLASLTDFYLKSDNKISEENMSLLENKLSFVYEFSLSPRFMEKLRKDAVELASALQRAVSLALKQAKEPEDIVTGFSKERSDAEKTLRERIGEVPQRAANAKQAIDAVRAEFFTLVVDKLDVMAFMVLRRVGVLDACGGCGTVASNSDEWRAYKPSWAQQCEIAFPQSSLSGDLAVQPADWFTSRFVTGLLRGRLDARQHHHGGKGAVITTNAFFKWVAPSVLALDLSRLPVTDEDLTAVSECFPDLKILLLSECFSITTAGVAKLEALHQLKYVRLSGAVNVSPAAMQHLRSRGVRADYRPLARSVAVALRDTAHRACAQLNKDTVHCVTRLSRARAARRRYGAYMKRVAVFLKQALGFLEALGVDADVMPAACAMFLDDCATELGTPAFEALFQIDTGAWENEERERQQKEQGKQEKGEDEQHGKGKEKENEEQCFSDADEPDEDEKAGDEEDARDEAEERGEVHQQEQQEKKSARVKGLFLVAGDPSRMWLKHLAMNRLELYKQRAEEERKAASATASTSATAPGSPSPDAPSGGSSGSLMTGLLALLKTKAAPEGGAAATTLDIVEQHLQDTFFRCQPTLTPRQLAISDLFRQTFEQLLVTGGGQQQTALGGGGGAGKKLTPQQNEQLKLWSIYGETESERMLEFLRDHVIAQARTLAGSVGAAPWKAKDKDITDELLQLVHTANSNGEKIRPEEVAQLLVRPYLQPGVRLGYGISVADVVSTLRRLREAHTALADFFGPPRGRSSGEAERHVYPAKFTAAQACGLWRHAMVRELLELFLPYYLRPVAAAAGGAPVMLPNPYLLRQVLLCSLIGVDVVPAVECEKCDFAKVLTKVQREIVWSSVCNVLTPHYDVFVRESALSMEEHWRSHDYSIFRKEKPKGVPSRNYLFESVFSHMFRDTGKVVEEMKKFLKELKPWERQLWENGAPLFLQSVDLSDITNEKQLECVGAALSRIAERRCKLIAVNMQNTAATVESLGCLPDTVLYLNLDMCPVGDDALDTVVAHCPHLKFLFMHDCRQASSDGIARACATLNDLRLIDISGNLNVTPEHVNQMVDATEGRLRVKHVLFTTFLNELFWTRSCKISRRFLKDLYEKLGTAGEPEALAEPANLSHFLGDELLSFVPNKVHTPAAYCRYKICKPILQQTRYASITSKHVCKRIRMHTGKACS